MSSHTISAREVAYDVLFAVETEDAYANLLLPLRISQARLSPQDAALATELCYGSLRMQGTYDHIIGSNSSRQISQLDPQVLICLRLGAHQLLKMRVPEHAALNETVNLARRHAGKSTTGFVNAILRKIQHHNLETWISLLRNNFTDPVDKLAFMYSHPAWIVRAFASALQADGRDDLEDLLAHDNVNPVVTYVKLPGLDSQTPAHSLPTKFSPYGFTVEHGGDPSQMPGITEGVIRVQDEGSQMAALTLVQASQSTPHERWLDLCAGPGGKAALLASFSELDEASLLANEVSQVRAGLVEKALAPFPHTTVLCRDGTAVSQLDIGTFHKVLVDAPCSGLGALRRRPEARWRKKPGDIGDLAQLQERLLSEAVKVTAPGGVVAYVTCSPHLAESRAVVNSVLKKSPQVSELNAKHVLSQVSKQPIDLGKNNHLSVQLWPHIHGTDAMFISLLKVEQ